MSDTEESGSSSSVSPTASPTPVIESLASATSSRREITLDEISTYFRLSFPEAASKLGICQTSLKKLCRKYGIARWPQRKLKGIDKKIASLKSELSYLDWSKSTEAAEKVLGLTEANKDIILGSNAEIGSVKAGIKNASSSVARSAPKKPMLDIPAVDDRRDIFSGPKTFSPNMGSRRNFSPAELSNMAHEAKPMTALASAAFGNPLPENLPWWHSAAHGLPGGQLPPPNMGLLPFNLDPRVFGERQLSSAPATPGHSNSQWSPLSLRFSALAFPDTSSHGDRSSAATLSPHLTSPHLVSPHLPMPPPMWNGVNPAGMPMLPFQFQQQLHQQLQQQLQQMQQQQQQHQSLPTTAPIPPPTSIPLVVPSASPVPPTQGEAPKLNVTLDLTL